MSLFSSLNALIISSPEPQTLDFQLETNFKQALMKEQLLYLLQRLNLPISFDRLSQWTKQSLIFPFYHTVQGESPLPHIHHLYPPRTIEQFTADLDFFLQHFQPIGLPDLLDHLQHQRALPKKAFLLSFDDGLREVYDFAAPILKQKGVPATIFLNANFVDNRALFFRYKTSLLIEHFNKNSVSPIEQEQVIHLLKLNSAATTISIVKEMLKIDHSKQKVLDEIATVLSIDFNDFLVQQKPYLDSHQIKRLMADGFTFGGHSVDHPKYAALSLAEQIDQTQKSVDFVQAQFGLNYKSFAFPFTDDGVKKSFFDQVEQRNISDVTFGCAGLKKQTRNNHFQRIPMEVYSSSAAQQLKGEYWYYLLKSCFGKQHDSR